MALTLWLSDEDDRALSMLAEADSISKQDAAIRAIHQTARRLRQDQIAQLSASAQERYADLLTRLGSD